MVSKVLTTFCLFLLASVSTASSGDAFSDILKKPYSLDQCVGQPDGCKKVVKTLIELENKVDNLQNKLEKYEKKNSKQKKSSEQPKPAKPIELNDKNFTEFVKSSEDPSFVLFYAPWCGHCKSMMGDFNKLAGFMKDKTVNIIKVDATENNELSRKFKIQGFPTLIFFPKGEKPTTYRMGRDFESFQSFLAPYTKTKITEPVIVNELISQSQYESDCMGKKNCIITVLPHLLDGGQSAGRKKAIDNVQKAINKDLAAASEYNFFWMEGGSNLDWEDAMIGGIGYPTTFLVNADKQEIVKYSKNNTDVDGLAQFIKKAKLMRPEAFRRTLPQFKNVQPWNGKDYDVEL